MTTRWTIQGSHCVRWGVVLLAAGCLFVLPHLIPAWPHTWLQQAMQHASAIGTEWGLHFFGVAVWHNGTILHTDLSSFAIPLVGHGAETAAWTCLLALAFAAWFRFRPLEMLTQALAALTVVLCSNILRLMLIVGIAPSADAMYAALRDSAGLFGGLMALAMIAITALVLHARHVRHYKRQRLRGAVTGALSEFPPFWHRVFRRHRSAFLLIPLATLLAIALIQTRPARRTALLQQVAEDLRDQGKTHLAIELAQRLAADEPDNWDWNMVLARMYLLDGQPRRSAQWLAGLGPVPKAYQPDKALLEAYIALVEDKQQRAADAIATLQTHSLPTPDWAILFAELAFARQDVPSLRAFVPVAAQDPLHASRLQPMLPFLHQTGSWPSLIAATTAVAATERSRADMIFRIHALLQMGYLPEASAETTRARQRAPDLFPLLFPLTLFAHDNPDEWSKPFRTAILLFLRTRSKPADLYDLLQSAFAASRPDLAWACFRKLQHTAPAHPYTALAWAMHQQEWFRFRRRHLGYPSDDEAAHIDLFPLLALARHVPHGNDILRHIPNFTEWIETGSAPDALREQARQQAGMAFTTIPPSTREEPLWRLQAQLLLSTGHTNAAETLLQANRQYHPHQPQAILALSDLQRQQGRSNAAYQRLLHYTFPAAATNTTDNELTSAWPPTPLPRPPIRAEQLPFLLRMLAYQIEGNMPVAASFTAREVLQRFPRDPLARTAAAAVHLRHQRPEQALVILQQTRHRRIPIADDLEAAALLASQRYQEVPLFRRQRLLAPTFDNAIPETIPERLPPAERLLTPPHPDEYDLQPETLRFPLDDWRNLTVALLTPRSEKHPALPADWSWPTNRLERAESLYRISKHLVAHQDLDMAALAARGAVHANPHVPTLWLQLLRLAPETETILSAARQCCPHDPDLWLAALVWQAHQPQPNRLPELLQEGLTAPDLPVDTLVRAADFLWRGGYIEEAIPLIDHWRGRARSLLPALLLEVEAASYRQDHTQTLLAIQRAIDASAQVAPDLYARYLHTKIQAGELETNQDFIQAIQAMRRLQPDVPFWSELLGYIRYQRGGTDMLEAGQAMQRAIADGSTNRIAFVIAAEAARRGNHPQDAVDILQSGLSLRPNDPVLLNNLAYTLAQNPASIPQAANLIPRLIPLAEQSAEFRDTLALVLLRSGSPELAHSLLSRNLRESSPDSVTWFRSQMRLAEMLWQQGQDQTAMSMLERLLRGARSIPHDDFLNANQLLTRMRSTQTNE